MPTVMTADTRGLGLPAHAKAFEDSRFASQVGRGM